MWETSIAFLAPEFSLAQWQLLRPFEEWISEQKLSVVFCHLNKYFFKQILLRLCLKIQPFTSLWESQSLYLILINTHSNLQSWSLVILFAQSYTDISKDHKWKFKEMPVLKLRWSKHFKCKQRWYRPWPCLGPILEMIQWEFVLLCMLEVMGVLDRYGTTRSYANSASQMSIKSAVSRILLCHCKHMASTWESPPTPHNIGTCMVKQADIKLFEKDLVIQDLSFPNCNAFILGREWPGMCEFLRQDIFF